MDEPEDLALVLERACRFTGRMHTDYISIREYAVIHLGIRVPGSH